MSAEYEVFLGGHDLEMLTIGELCKRAGVRVHDRCLHWGAAASAYRREIESAVAAGHTPLLVELVWDLPGAAGGIVLVDHHGESAGRSKPSALRQVHDRLGSAAGPWTRQLALVEANDIGWIPGLLEAGATADEIRAIRAADRGAQGVSADEELAAAAAVRAATTTAGGRLWVITSPHDRSAPITDRLHSALGGPDAENVLIFGPKETQFFGNGEVVLALAKAYPQCWYGGALPARGYWGLAECLQPDALRPRVEELLA